MRYTKQELIEGWDQKKLKDSNVVIVGSNNLTSFILIDLIAMGFGNIRRIGGSSFPFIDFYKLNPDVKIDEISGEIINNTLAEDYIGQPDFIIESSKDKSQKKICLKYAQERRIPAISATCSDKFYSVKPLENNDNLEKIVKFGLENMGPNDGETNAVITSGIVVDEVRKRIMPLEKDQKLKRLYGYWLEEKIDKRVLLVGAGAIGTFAGISLALKEAEVDVIDFDYVEESNLNRQILFYDSIGRYKAEVMAEKFSDSGKFRPIVGKIDEKYKLERNYDIILSCVDNSEARYYLNLISYKNKIPLINSGTSTFAGNVMPYVYGKTACLDCQTFGRLNASIGKKDENSCYKPSIILSNQIIGGLLVNKIPNIFKNKLETIKYNSNSGIRNITTLENCLNTCKKNERL